MGSRARALRSAEDSVIGQPFCYDKLGELFRQSQYVRAGA